MVNLIHQETMRQVCLIIIGSVDLKTDGKQKEVFSNE
jgi:hypothetical protein